MSVYIHGMEMPTGCLHCFLFSGQGCKATNKLFPDWLNVATRPTGCPLIFVPDHGRLIDADALISDIRKHSQSYFADDFAHEWVDVAPTIIPAEEESGDVV